MTEWSLRDEILATSHRWPLIVMFCLIGVLAGWGASRIWPSPHRATAELYVGLNIYRAFEDRNAVSFADGIKFSSPDDYKNWQMADLNTAIMMDDVIKKTLTRLRQEDDYWDNISRDELRGMFHVYWRNAGKWLLVAENPNAKYAEQAVAAWRDVVVERIAVATDSAQDTMSLDMRLQTLSDAQTQPSAHLSDLNQIRAALLDWQTNAGQWPKDEAVKSDDRWQLWSLVGRIAGSGPTWESLLNAFPPPDSNPQAYLSWLNQVMISLDNEIKLTQGQLDALEKERASLVEQYGSASKKSLGLSANLEVAKVSDAAPHKTVVRPTGMLMLIGGILGFMLWALIWLARLAMRSWQ